ncbi:hypothetical protein ACPW7Z_02340 [Bifidobacterium adolescentis]|uniref:hypothetical protein n=1 Tax=Bifidobacterium adolescentis TaxID=1680 RepID=UPI002EAD51AE|nr:hypothetical protein [Bifidobacterium adolescentis]
MKTARDNDGTDRKRNNHSRNPAFRRQIAHEAQNDYADEDGANSSEDDDGE